MLTLWPDMVVRSGWGDQRTGVSPGAWPHLAAHGSAEALGAHRDTKEPALRLLRRECAGKLGSGRNTKLARDGDPGSAGLQRSPDAYLAGSPGGSGVERRAQGNCSREGSCLPGG